MHTINFVKFNIMETVVTLTILLIVYYHYARDIEDFIQIKFPLTYKKITRGIHLLLGIIILVTTVLVMIIL